MTEQRRRSTKLRATLPLFAAALLLAPVTRSFAQSQTQSAGTAAPLLTYEAVSIHENKSGIGGMTWMNSPDGMTTTNVSLMNLISSASGINQDLISGAPGWVENTGYDIQAKVDGEDVAKLKALTGKQRGAMLQALLAERFHLKTHIVPKSLPVYDLVVDKGGPKFKEAPSLPGVKGEDAEKGGMMRFGPGEFTAQKMPIKNLADNLAFVVHRTVIDKTGLTGKYNFTLKYQPEQHDAGKTDNGETDQAPSIFTALQEQLGLKLQPTRGPVDTLVIDHVEKPTEN